MSQIIGTVDGFDPPSKIRGWARWFDDRLEPLYIKFVRDGQVVAEGVPNLFRSDILNVPGVNAGFELDVGSLENLLDVLLGKMSVVIEADSGSRVVASLWQRARAVALSRISANWLQQDQDATIDALSEFASGLSSDNPLQGVIRRTLANARNSLQAAIPPPSQLEPSLILIPAGTPSSDGSAIVGRDGWLFLKDGSNNLLDLYAETNKSLQCQIAAANEWSALFAKRRALHAGAGRAFYQLIVPEKTSALAEKFTIPINAPTACLKELEHRLASDASYISVASIVSAVGNEAFYRKTDTHPSALGHFAMARAIAARCGVDERLDLLDIVFDKKTLVTGDLSERFFGVPMLEQALLPRSASLDLLSPSRESVLPSASGRTKSGSVYYCPNAPIDLTVLVFGNSVFNHGVSPLDLTWWCSRLFRNLHFYWEAETDPAYLERVAPDVVVCQTVERFLLAGAPLL